MEQTVKTTNTMPGQEIPNSANMRNTNSVALFNDLREESDRKMMLSMLFNQFLVSRKYIWYLGDTMFLLLNLKNDRAGLL